MDGAENLYPSTAHLDANGRYVADELNQPLSSADFSAHTLGQLVHGVKPGYCEAHKRLGCEVCA
jgi:hypothetical protein